MIPVVSRDRIRALDRHAVDVCKVPSLVLMENAGRGAAELVTRRISDLGVSGAPVAIVCGAGNNGGDGFVVARRLRAGGHDARVFLVAKPEQLKGDARANYDAWIGVGGGVVGVGDGEAPRLSDGISPCPIVVDGLFGTGLDRNVSGLFADVIGRFNVLRAHRVALDIPSGLDANTGRPLGVAVRAHDTVTFAAMKLGLVTSSGAEHAGKITVADIGVPPTLLDAMGAPPAFFVEESDARGWLSPRPLALHKGGAGHVVLVAGSPGKTGAALLAARGALRAGAGLVTVCTSPEAADALDLRVLEEMTLRIDPARIEASLDEALERATAVVVGPGLGLGPDARRIVDHVVFGFGGPKVVDADALTHLSGRLGELVKARGALVLTPHPGEMARLLGVKTVDVEGDRFEAVSRAVGASGAVVLLKGARTLIGAPGQATLVNSSGCPALATAGSGDVLSGITAAFLATIDDARRAATLAAFVHGRSGERWSAQTGADRGLLAHEIADGVPGVLAGLTRPEASLPV
jgi:NAD(P)H-hydrate epimerase